MAEILDPLDYCDSRKPGYCPGILCGHISAFGIKKQLKQDSRLLSQHLLEMN
jgi:hypothetical protein